MAQSTEQTMTCDHCGKKVSDGGHTYYGGSPFNGWINVLLKNFSMDSFMSYPDQKNNLDFCCVNCMVEYFQKEKVEKTSL